MATLSDLAARTHEATHERAERSRLIGLKPRKGTIRRITLHVQSSESYSDPAGHFVTILWPTIPDLRVADYEVLPAVFTPTTTRVRAYCSCPAFKYTGPAYHSTQERWRLPNRRQENRVPNERDPEGVRIVCKHVIRCQEELDPVTFTHLAQLFNIRGPLRQPRRKSSEELRVLSIRDAIPHIETALQHTAALSAKDLDYVKSILTDDNWESIFEDLGVINAEEL